MQKRSVQFTTIVEVLVLLVLTTWLSACKTVRPVQLEPQFALPPSTDAHWVGLEAQAPEDRVSILNQAEEALEWRLRLIDSARQSLDLQVFLWKPDEVGGAIYQHVLQAADRGVRVRILLDDSFTMHEGEWLSHMDQHPNVELRVYNPFLRRSDSVLMRQLLNVGDFSLLNHRMHNKSMMVDNRAAIIGGRNLADEYFGAHAVANFRDMEALILGPSVKDLSVAFDLYWNSQHVVPSDHVFKSVTSTSNMVMTEAQVHAVDQEGAWQSFIQNSFPSELALLVDGVSIEGALQENAGYVADRVIEVFDQAQEEIIIATAYLIPTEKTQAVVERVTDRGVDICVLTNSLRSNNHTSAHAAYRHHLRWLMERRAKLYEVRALANDRGLYMRSPVEDKHLGLHSKVGLVDHDVTLIGSLNLDPRSLRINTEMVLFIRGSEVNEHIRSLLEIDFQRENAWELQLDDSGEMIWVGHDQTLSAQPAESVVQRIEDWFFGLLPIEGEM